MKKKIDLLIDIKNYIDQQKEKELMIMKKEKKKHLMMKILLKEIHLSVKN